MRILFIVPYVPNLIRVRPYNLIRHLAGHGHQVTVVTLWSNDAERACLTDLQKHTEKVISARMPRWRSIWNSISALPSRTPLQAVYSWQPSLARLIEQEVSHCNGKQGYDVIHVEHLRGAQYGLFLKTIPGAPPVVWDSVDSISHLFRQAIQRSKSFFGRSVTRLELGRTERYEPYLVRQFNHITVTSPQDKQAFLELLPDPSPHAPITILPNGVDLEYFQPNSDLLREPGTIVISGKMSYHANVTMVLFLLQDIMPLVWVRKPEARVLVVGKDPGREILSYASDPRVTVTGTVDHLPPYLQKATVAVAPIAYGAGIQNKVLEAMACETPVVVSPLAINALSVRQGQELLVASGAEEFAASILSLLDDADKCREIGKAGRRYVERNHHWPVTAVRLGEIYRSVLSERSGDT